MSVGARFATGKHAYGICDICGVSYRLVELRMTTIRGRQTGLMVCPTDFDPDHPQNFLPEALVVDAIALRNARPEDYRPSRILRPRVFFVDSVTAAFAVGEVEVSTE